MTRLLRLPARLAGAAAGAARSTLQLAEAAAEAAIGRVCDRGHGDGERAPAPAAPPAPPAADLSEPPPPTAVPEPTRGQAARIRAERRAAEQTEDGPGARIRVDEPWPGYSKMNAPEIVDRLRSADAAVKAVVALYERRHRKRKTVIEAAGG